MDESQITDADHGVLEQESASEKYYSNHHGGNHAPYPYPDRQLTITDSDSYMNLPSYVTKAPEGMAIETLAGIAANGAFILPPVNIQNALLKCYTQYVHPNMPFLDLGELLEAAVLRCHGRQTSMLLLQAVLFAGAIFVEPVYLHLLGYTSRTAALRDLFGRAKLLYEFGFETKKIYIVQSLLLFTLFQDDCQTGPSFWMGEVCKAAMAAGLQHDPGQTHMNGHSNGALRRRLWWCFYTQDRLLALSARHPMYIRKGITTALC